MMTTDLSGDVVIYCDVDDLRQGLFGKVVLWVFEVLPFLHESGIFPRWEIRSRLYAESPDFVVIPGIFDLAYDPPAGSATRVSLLDLHARYHRALGGDWSALSDLWSRYFRVPRRISDVADRQGPLASTLGVHYRGTDKALADWDTNPVSHADFITLVLDFLQQEGAGLTRIFAASDDHAFVSALASRTPLDIVNLGPVDAYWDVLPAGRNALKADRVLLDCLLLSRCGAVLQTSSALSAFTKILRPDLRVYRCAASKIFTDRPYFPAAYLPTLASPTPAVAAILARTMAGDWRQEE